ncbi:uncharacterized protein LOC131891648 [Tigriopus californicus]|uniref:uncharacterized protein LOC131891648 n=1 Tax=Tigriopus californicus TaxID=6832 RepID=UPI0027DA79EF|nr:uncharacterized protein LOC131891648 [Tigriopus californicus]
MYLLDYVQFSLFLLLVACFAAAQENKTSTRQGKVFSLFNIVQFNNDGCRSSSTFSSGNTGSTRRNGTCFTSSECSSKGGSPAGNCASGFGICCVFFVSNSGDTITQNCTYLRNPNFPNTLTDTSSLSYTVRKCDSRVCMLRLDFESFTLLGTGNSIENDGAGEEGGRCLDEFTATSNSGFRAPIICGLNTGQHMYVDMGCLASDTASLDFNFDAQTSARMWEIKVTQIPCNTAGHPTASGCLQYHVGLTGRLTTFNFIPTNDNHLRNQQYSICIRQESGMCCIQYSECEDANSFTLDQKNDNKGFVDNMCTKDYVGIEGGASALCGGSTNVATRTRFCGTVLNVVDESKMSTPICDCNKPFRVDIFTDDTADDPAKSSRGVCLEYTQIPC